MDHYLELSPSGGYMVAVQPFGHVFLHCDELEEDLELIARATTS